MSQDKNALTTLAAPGLPRRAVLSGILAAAGSVAVVAGAAAASGVLAIAADPMVDLLRTRQVMMDAVDAFTGDDDDPVFIAMMDEANAFEDEQIVGTPVQSMLGAFLAIDAVRRENCKSSTDEWLICTVHDFLSQYGDEGRLA
jgi:hypothetical protein